MKCPVCSSRHFYLKDPDDPYETYAFEVIEEGIQFSDSADAQHAPAIEADTEAYCDTCSWHGKIEK